MQSTCQIFAIEPLDPRVEGLADLAREDGFRFLDRLISEARSGTNLFDKAGEAFLGAVQDGALVGCGGLNIDPYADYETGRLRHVYVSHDARRRGIATALVTRLVHVAHQSFTSVRLRTPGKHADVFYETIGFKRVSEHAATHKMRF